jgi:hypothetical protein
VRKRNGEVTTLATVLPTPRIDPKTFPTPDITLPAALNKLPAADFMGDKIPDTTPPPPPNAVLNRNAILNSSFSLVLLTHQEFFSRRSKGEKN